MAAKTANVMARVEPDVKKQAEEIMEQLGIPASVVINMLYRQIILKKGIPFSVTVPNAPVSREEMDDAMFDAVMQQGYEEAMADKSRPAAYVFAELRENL